MAARKVLDGPCLKTENDPRSSSTSPLACTPTRMWHDITMVRNLSAARCSSGMARSISPQAAGGSLLQLSVLLAETRARRGKRSAKDRSVAKRGTLSKPVLVKLLEHNHTLLPSCRVELEASTGHVHLTRFSKVGENFSARSAVTALDNVLSEGVKVLGLLGA